MEDNIEIVKVKVTIDKPFEVGQTYMTKMATKWMFKITSIKGNHCMGIYEQSPDIGECPLPLERLIPYKDIIEGEKKVCKWCKKPL